MSPTTVSSRAAPSPISSLTTTGPVAMPTRAASVSPCARCQARVPPRPQLGRPAPRVRPHPHGRADSRNRPAHHRPCTSPTVPFEPRDRARHCALIGRAGLRPFPPDQAAPQRTVESTRSMNITVSWRRSASAAERDACAEIAAGAAVARVVAEIGPTRRAAMAASSLRRWPDRGDAELDQILGREVHEDLSVDVVLAERLLRTVPAPDPHSHSP